MNGEKGKKFLLDYIENTNGLLDKYLEEKLGESKIVGNAPHDLLSRFFATAVRGKRIRGALTTLGYLIGGGKLSTDILDASLFIELFHVSVLVQDDISDRAPTRRGLPSIHMQFAEGSKDRNLVSSPLHFGESMALYAGDAGLYFAVEKLLQSNFPAEIKIKAGLLYTEYILRVVYGQVLDVANVIQKNITEEDILNVHKYKAAEYTGVFPLLAGATLAGVENQAQLQALKDYGLAFGWAFQIQDDVLDLFAKDDSWGKPIGMDLKEGKNTLFVLHVFKHGTEVQKEFMKKVLGNENITPTEINDMKNIFKDSGAYDYVIDTGWKYVEEGKKYIPQATENKEYQEILESLIVYMMERTK